MNHDNTYWPYWLVIVGFVLSAVAVLAFLLSGGYVTDRPGYRLLAGILVLTMLFVLAWHAVSKMFLLQAKHDEFEVKRLDVEQERVKRQEEIDRAECELDKQREHELELSSIKSQRKITVVRV